MDFILLSMVFLKNISLFCVYALIIYVLLIGVNMNIKICIVKKKVL